jgi:hypothetical protein
LLFAAREFDACHFCFLHLFYVLIITPICAYVNTFLQVF